MLAFALRRAGETAVTLVLLCAACFAVLRAAPGGPAAVLLGPDFWSPEREAALNQSLGLDQPIPVQLVRWMGAVASGDLGVSYFHRRPAGEVVLERVGPTLILGGIAWSVSVLGGLALGMIAARSRGGWADRLASSVAITVLSMPPFWLALLLIVVFAAWLGVLPSAGLSGIGREQDLADKAAHLILPMTALALPHLASLALYVRATVLEVSGSDYVRTAQAKGLAESVVFWGHVLRNASIPIATMAGLNLAHMLEGSLVVEAVFAWPGIGLLALTSAGRRDYPVLLLLALIAGLIVVIANFLTDLAYRWLDPRLDYA